MLKTLSKSKTASIVNFHILLTPNYELIFYQTQFSFVGVKVCVMFSHSTSIFYYEWTVCTEMLNFTGHITGALQLEPQPLSFCLYIIIAVTGRLQGNNHHLILRRPYQSHFIITQYYNDKQYCSLFLYRINMRLLKFDVESFAKNCKKKKKIYTCSRNVLQFNYKFG